MPKKATVVLNAASEDKESMTVATKGREVLDHLRRETLRHGSKSAPGTTPLPTSDRVSCSEGGTRRSSEAKTEGHLRPTDSKRT